MAELPRDTFGRPLASLRLSVTDRCNLRCRYCMPEDEYVWLPRTAILTFEEIERLVALFAGLGVHKVRLTGGEPLLRHDLATLVTMIARNPQIRDLAMTTNGLLLAKHAAALRAAGLERVTVSLDTLHPERMLAFAKSTRHADVLEGITAARQAGFAKLKLNAVVIRGFNDDELADLIEFARVQDAEVRFIEYMDVGAPPAGPRTRSCPNGRCWTCLAGATVRSSRWRPTAARPPSGSGSRTGPRSASSPRSRRRSAAPATAAGSPRPGLGSCVCTPPGASICASRHAALPPMKRSRRSSGSPGRIAATGGRG